MSLATPHKPEWRTRATRLREISAEISEMTSHFNLERESCKCGESHRWKDMTQWQLHDRLTGMVKRLDNIARDIDRRSHEFITPSTGD